MWWWFLRGYFSARDCRWLPRPPPASWRLMQPFVTAVRSSRDRPHSTGLTAYIAMFSQCTTSGCTTSYRRSRSSPYSSGGDWWSSANARRLWHDGDGGSVGNNGRLRRYRDGPVRVDAPGRSDSVARNDCEDGDALVGVNLSHSYDAWAARANNRPGRRGRGGRASTVAVGNRDLLYLNEDPLPLRCRQATYLRNSRGTRSTTTESSPSSGSGHELRAPATDPRLVHRPAPARRRPAHGQFADERDSRQISTPSSGTRWRVRYEPSSAVRVR